jgi:hypothetical protein
MGKKRKKLAAVLMFSCLAMLSGESAADPIQMDPFGFKITVYLWVIVVSIIGGITGYVRKLKGKYSRFSIAEVLGECLISAFVGIITFWLCEAADIKGAMQAAFIAISSHMGSRALFKFEQKLFEKLPFLRDIPDTTGDNNDESK